VASGSGYAADRDKVDWQLATRTDEAARLTFSIDLIREKLVQSSDTLERRFEPTAQARQGNYQDWQFYNRASGEPTG
jgi:hypothetical protein